MPDIKENEHHIKASTIYLEDSFDKLSQILETGIQIWFACSTMYVQIWICFDYWRIQISRPGEPSLTQYWRD